jgi:hypothetical protein
MRQGFVGWPDSGATGRQRDWQLKVYQANPIAIIKHHALYIVTGGWCWANFYIEMNQAGTGGQPIYFSLPVPHVSVQPAAADSVSGLTLGHGVYMRPGVAANVQGSFMSIADNTTYTRPVGITNQWGIITVTSSGGVGESPSFATAVGHIATATLSYPVGPGRN